MGTGSGVLRGHRFHYSILETTLSGVDHTVTHRKNTPGEAIYRVGSPTASYFHAYFPSSPGALATVLGGKGAQA